MYSSCLFMVVYLNCSVRDGTDHLFSNCFVDVSESDSDEDLPSLSATSTNCGSQANCDGKAFSSTLAVAYALLSCCKGQGLSKDDTNRFLNAIHDPRFQSKDVQIRTYDDLQKLCNKLEDSLLGYEVILPWIL